MKLYSASFKTSNAGSAKHSEFKFCKTVKEARTYLRSNGYKPLKGNAVTDESEIWGRGHSSDVEPFAEIRLA